MADLGASRPHAWERWLPTWHGLFVVSLAVTNFLTILEVGFGPQAWAALATSAALAVWYWAFFVRVRPWEPPVWQMTIYVAGLLLAWLILVRVAPAFFYLQATIYPQVFFALPIRLAAIAAFALAALSVVTEATRSGTGLDPGVLVGTLALVGMFVLLSAWIAAIIDQSVERSRLIRELESTRAELAAVERQTGVLEERGRLAREIHDTLAQGFTSVVMHLEAADAALDQDRLRAQRHLVEARRTARDSLAESRRFLAALRPEALESSPLLETLGRVVGDWSAETGIRATFTIAGQRRDAGPEADVTLLRGLQEALANVRKHAAATDVAVTLSYLDDRTSLDIRDDGVGFDPATVGGGYGLLGMRERAARAGGEVVVESTPGEGTTVALALPTQAAESESTRRASLA